MDQENGRPGPVRRGAERPPDRPGRCRFFSLFQQNIILQIMLSPILSHLDSSFLSFVVAFAALGVAFLVSRRVLPALARFLASEPCTHVVVCSCGAEWTVETPEGEYSDPVVAGICPDCKPHFASSGFPSDLGPSAQGKESPGDALSLCLSKTLSGLSSLSSPSRGGSNSCSAEF